MTGKFASLENVVTEGGLDDEVQQQYASLPESVKASMGMGGPSDAGPSGVSQHG